MLEDINKWYHLHVINLREDENNNALAYTTANLLRMFSALAEVIIICRGIV